MRRTKRETIGLICLWIVLGLSVNALADVSPGEVIDRTNWEKVEGWVPDSVLDWIKKGNWELQIEALNYDTSTYHTQFALEAFETNVGKYGLDDDAGIVDLETGKLPEHIVGIPFPGIDPKDPKAAVKIMHNNHYMQYLIGDLRFPFSMIWVGPSGHEREVGAVWMQAAMDGWPGARDRGNQEKIEKYSVALVQRPFDVKGTAVMTWRYMEASKPDSSFGYFPAIRRVRRMSPANRSDAFVGSDAAVDDANGYDGKVAAFDWKLLRKQEAIVPWYDRDPVRVVENEAGEWETTRNVKKAVYGYEKEGWQGAPWAPTNLAWVKRPVYIIEMRPKDRYYNYGMQVMWLDAETFSCNYKVIHDRSGAYWKTFVKGDISCTGANGRMKFHTVAVQVIVDDRRSHATVIEDFSPKNVWAYFAHVDLNNFSLGGFQKFNK